MKAAYSCFKGISVSFLLSLPLVNCAYTPHSEQVIYKPLQQKSTVTAIDHRNTYVREVTPEEQFQTQKISFVGQVALVDVLRRTLPSINVIPQDMNVDMSKMLNIHAKDLSAYDFLDYLSATSGYEVAFRKGNVAVSSFVKREWNLALFSAKRQINLRVGKAFSSSAGGGRNTFNGRFNDDEWKLIVEGAERILGVQSDAKEGELAPYVNAIRSVGVLSAGGEPSKIAAVDQFVQSIVEKGSKQINIAVQAYEVTLDDSRGAGINWEELKSVGSFNGNPIDFNFTSSGGEAVNSLFQSTAGYDGDKFDARAILNFLNNYGEVELLNQPNVTVRNGTYAYISAGEELTYVAEIETEDEADGDDKTTLSVDSIRVGVTLSVAPRILKDGRILLEIWPSISSADLSKEIQKGSGEGIVLPKIQLQELATEVITESGRPVQLGGFIRRAIAKNLSELPWKERISGKILRPLFKSENADLNRTELVLTVTPTVVEGV